MKKQTWEQWLRANARDPESPCKVRKAMLGALTGQDYRTLGAIAACWELFSNSDADGQKAALRAIRALLPAMQKSTRWFAREMIPFAMNWEDRERLWPLVCSYQEAQAS